MEVDEICEQSESDRCELIEGGKYEEPGRSNNSAKRHITKNLNNICDEPSEKNSDKSFKRKKINEDEMAKGDGNSGNLPRMSDPPNCKSPRNTSDVFPKINSRFKSRNYRSKSQTGSIVGTGSSDEETLNGQEITCSELNQCSPVDGAPQINSENKSREESENVHPNASEALTDCTPNYSLEGKNDVTKRPVDRVSVSSISSSNGSSTSIGTSSSTSSSTSDSTDSTDSDDEAPSILLKQKPKHKWFATPEIVNRQIGYSNTKQGSGLFKQRMYGSLHSVQRLELMYELMYHTSCVNSLNFNQSGNLLASGSDDLKICLWDWSHGKLLTSFDSGHTSNVFQALFLPLAGNTHMVTCARDGQIRLAELGSNGEARDTVRLAQHRGPVHKLAIQKETPHVFLSAGEDARILRFDIRQPKPSKLMSVKDNGKKISLYSVHSNPLNNREFVICGRDCHLRIYDQRNTSSPKSKFRPQHLNVDSYLHVSCAVFNYNGTEVVASYNDEDIYLFDTRHSDGCDFVHRYQGHRNSTTVKGVNFFGPKSEFIVSGSDCGNIFFWEKETEAIVQWMAGDENGVVNCLEPHPEIPVLATSGLDEDIKIWVPSCTQEPTLKGLKKTVITNLKRRRTYLSSDTFNAQWIFQQGVRRTDRIMRRVMERRRRLEGSLDGEISNSSSTNSDDDDGHNGRGRLQCSPS